MSSLYPRRSARATTTLARLASVGPRLLAKAAFKVVTVIGFKGTQAGVEQLSLRHDDDVEAGSSVVATENLSNQSFSSVALDRPPQFPRGGDPQTANRQPVRQEEKGAETAANPGAPFIDLLKIGASANVLVGAEFHRQPSVFSHQLSLACALSGADSREPKADYSLLTESRLRPLARRRLSTSRPFLVLMRTRNPCARLRWRVFG